MEELKYHVWTIGCQMNVADSQRLGSELEKFGYRWTDTAEEADVVVLNTCVVRQQAEDKIYGRLGSLKPWRKENPDKVLGVMGCLVGVKNPKRLEKRFPYVDVFLPPSEPQPLVEYLEAQKMDEIAAQLEQQEVEERFQLQDQELGSRAPDDTLVLPEHERGNLVSAHVPIIYRCDHVCTFCIIPYRRGTERSRPVGEIAREVRSLVAQGVKEVTLLGQIVDRYGYDVPDGPRLADLLRVIHEIEGLERIRFLTSHPIYMNDRLLEAVAELPKVCEHIEVPVQAGDDEVLERMQRGYTADDYRALIGRIREILPEAAIHTDIIVGFPGETEEQFMETYNLLAKLKLDKAHIAKFSPRPNTAAAVAMEDDVPPEEKERRRRMLDELMEDVVGEINSRYLGETVEILVEEKHKGKWKGRTRTNKLVFFEDSDHDWRGKLVDVEITWTGPWSMQAELPGMEEEEAKAGKKREKIPLAAV